MCETWWFEGLANDAHTAGDCFSNTRVKPNPPIENVAYLLVECCVETRYTGVGKSWSRRAGVDAISLTI